VEAPTTTALAVEIPATVTGVVDVVNPPPAPRNP
jgi:hypothetical protein